MLTFTHHDVVLIRKGTDEGVGQLRERKRDVEDKRRWGVTHQDATDERSHHLHQKGDARRDLHVLAYK